MKTSDFLSNLAMHAEEKRMVLSEKFHETQNPNLLKEIGELSYIEYAYNQFSTKAADLEYLIDMSEWTDKELTAFEIKETLSGGDISLIFNDILNKFINKLPKYRLNNLEKADEVDAIENYFNTSIEVDQFKENFDLLLCKAQSLTATN